MIMFSELALRASSLASWQAVTAAVVLSMSLATLIIQGILAHKKGNGSNRGLWVASMAGGVLLLFSASAHYCAEAVDERVDLTRGGDVDAITEKLAQVAISRQATQDSQSLARIRFIESGRIERIVLESGAVGSFSPTETDYLDRDNWLRNWAEIQRGIALLRALSMAWVLLPIGALFAATTIRKSL